MLLIQTSYGYELLVGSAPLHLLTISLFHFYSVGTTLLSGLKYYPMSPSSYQLLPTFNQIGPVVWSIFKTNKQ